MTIFIKILCFLAGCPPFGELFDDKKGSCEGPQVHSEDPIQHLVGKRVVIAAEQLHTGLSFRHHDTPRPLCSDTATGTVDHRYSASGRRTKPRPRRGRCWALGPRW